MGEVGDRVIGEGRFRCDRREHRRASEQRRILIGDAEIVRDGADNPCALAAPPRIRPCVVAVVDGVDDVVCDGTV